MVNRTNPTPDLAVLLITETAASELMGGAARAMLQYNAGDQHTPQVRLWARHGKDYTCVRV
jgi:hypothetical protein